MPLEVITSRDADKHGAVVVGVLHQDQKGLGDEVVLAQVAVSQGEQEAVLPRRLVTTHDEPLTHDTHHDTHLVIQVPPEEHIRTVLVPGLEPDQPRPGPRHPEYQGVPVRVIAPQPGIQRTSIEYPGIKKQDKVF